MEKVRWGGCAPPCRCDLNELDVFEFETDLFADEEFNEFCFWLLELNELRIILEPIDSVDVDSFATIAGSDSQSGFVGFGNDADLSRDSSRRDVPSGRGWGFDWQLGLDTRSLLETIEEVSVTNFGVPVVITVLLDAEEDVDDVESFIWACSSFDLIFLFGADVWQISSLW